MPLKLNENLLIESAVRSSKQNKPVNEAIDKMIASCALVLLSPCYIVNVCGALIQRNPIFSKKTETDCLNRTVAVRSFTFGLFKRSAVLFDVLQNKVSLFGLPSSAQMSMQTSPQLAYFQANRFGIFNSVTLNQKTGLETHEQVEQASKHLSATGIVYIGILVRHVLASLLYTKQLKQDFTQHQFSIFGLSIDNVSMQEAIDWTLSKSEQQCKTACFINVNSINQCARSMDLTLALKGATKRFADGSGLRLAAKHLGFQIRSNVNGTDMLPLLCEQMCQQNKSLYLLGAAPGIAKKAAKRLKTEFPNLNIVGVRHGYFNHADSDKEVDRINQSGADIVLVALGSPHQEKWLLKNVENLQCGSALAVGGLLDFYADKFSRAPLWMRELGMEWIWRLLQEPKTKFNRYVIGNPIFLFRTYFTQQARRGF